MFVNYGYPMKFAISFVEVSDTYHLGSSAVFKPNNLNIYRNLILKLGHPEGGLYINTIHSAKTILKIIRKHTAEH